MGGRLVARRLSAVASPLSRRHESKGWFSLSKNFVPPGLWMRLTAICFVLWMTL